MARGPDIGVAGLRCGKAQGVGYLARRHFVIADQTGKYRQARSIRTGLAIQPQADAFHVKMHGRDGVPAAHDRRVGGNGRWTGVAFIDKGFGFIGETREHDSKFWLIRRHGDIGDADERAVVQRRGEIRLQRRGRTNGVDVNVRVRIDGQVPDRGVPHIVSGENRTGANRSFASRQSWLDGHHQERDQRGREFQVNRHGCLPDRADDDRTVGLWQRKHCGIRRGYCGGWRGRLASGR